ncbi:flagellar protein FlbT [Novosphingobium sp. PhB55]|uniref:flagellar biosynthesis repressor FlbT n=1 Tax=Novosphingobium sp. PhB55 TaxID=2485106 RepID=UPI00106513A4|nr:flagellar biosynthesis repressor FlbT [Novosphingobium sp. PhB55]TDW59268.1 flagellar protein FlbT [Novosphingobium sp. PhB55]
MALRLTLKKGEPVIVNGVVLRTMSRTDLLVETEATVLRGREVMKPEEATTPARKLYFACMMAYIDPIHLEKHQQTLLQQLRALIEAFEAPEAKAVCVRFAENVAAGSFFKALADCKWIIGYETEALCRGT